MKTIDSIPRETLVQALEPVVICEIARENFLRFLDRCPTEVIRLLKTVGGHLRNIEAKFGDLVLHNAAARLAKLLLQLCETIGENDKGTIRLNVQLTHQNLVNLIGTSRKPSAPYSVNFNGKD
jgi:CRP/FNR family transcriptional regulator